MTTPVKHGKRGPIQGRRSAAPRKRRASTTGSPRRVREEFGISLPRFARITGVPDEVLAAWEAGGKMGRDDLAKVEKVAGLLQRLSHVMPKAAVAPWLGHANSACRSAGGRTPADLMKKGRYDKIEAMIYFFESGVPF